MASNPKVYKRTQIVLLFEDAHTGELSQIILTQVEKNLGYIDVSRSVEEVIRSVA